MAEGIVIENRRGLVVFGGGGFATELLSWIDDIRKHQVISPWFLWPLATYIDNPFEAKKTRTALPVLKSLDGMRDNSFVLATGDPRLREKHARMAEAAGMSAVYPLMHPRALTADDIFLGFGALLCPGAIACPGANIGEHVLMNLNTTVGHQSELGEFSVLSPGAHVSGDCVLGKRVYVGTNAAIREKVRIADDVTIGMGAVVLSDIEEAGTTWVGNPARKLVRSVETNSGG